MPLPKQKKNNGYTMLVTAIIFTLVSVVIVLGLTTPIVKQILLSDDIWGAKQSYYLSEAGAEDVLYRLKSATFNQYVGTSEPITLAGYSATTTLSGSLGGVNGITLTTLSNKSGYDKKIQTTVKQGSGVSFTYGVQVGTGGISLNSSKIVGNVYSAGNIVMTNPTSAITGSAIVSDSPSMTADQENDTPTSSPDTISFTNAAATQDVAQSFQVSSTSVLTQASLYLKEVGSPSSNITVDIVKDKNGSPSTSASDIVSSATISSSLITSNFDWVDVALSPNPSLIVGNTYWLVLNGSTNSSSNYYVIGANLDTSYASGTAKTGQLGSTWNNTGYDAYFRIYLGGFFGSISGEGQYNTLSVGSVSTDMAWAHSISYVNVTGPLRCQNDTLNSKACDQTYPDPSPVLVSGLKRKYHRMGDGRDGGRRGERRLYFAVRSSDAWSGRDQWQSARNRRRRAYGFRNAVCDGQCHSRRRSHHQTGIFVRIERRHHRHKRHGHDHGRQQRDRRRTIGKLYHVCDDEQLRRRLDMQRQLCRIDLGRLGRHRSECPKRHDLAVRRSERQ